MTVDARAAPAALHFSRFEFKYVLDGARRAAVEAELRLYVDLDPHVRHLPEQVYFVRSLYFDDAALTAYHQKLDGRLARAKFRVRTYGREPGAAPRFLESKGRHDQQVFKHRAPIAAAADPLAGGDALVADLLEHTAPGRVRDEFACQVFRRKLRPIALVDYMRRPYVGRSDPDFRLTFDSDLAATATATLFPTPARPVPLLRGYTVMEVKFRRHVPAWFVRLLQTWQLRRVSLSKICTACEHLGLPAAPRAAHLDPDHCAWPWLRA